MGGKIAVEMILDSIDNINEWIGKICSWSVIVILILVVLEVIKRKIFNAPSLWNLDVTTHLYGFHFMIVTAYTLKHDRHVKIDVFSNKFSEKTRTIIDIISFLLFFFPFSFVLLWEGIKFASKSWVMLETGWGAFHMPLYPLKTVIPLAAFLLILQGFVIFTRKLQYLIKGDRHV